MLSAKTELGFDNIKKYCVMYDAQNNSYVNSRVCRQVLNNQVKIVGNCNYKTVPRTYNNAAEGLVDKGTVATPYNRLSDGTCYYVNVNASTIGISVDINGASKGPNLFGHDIFFFHIDENDRLSGFKMESFLDDEQVQNYIDSCIASGGSGCNAGAAQAGYPCTNKSNQKGNGIGCTWFAINDICPDDPTKGYWDCLP